MNLTPEEIEIGRDNYYEAVGAYHAFGPDVNRRDFLKTAIGSGLVTGAGLGAMYFGYDKKPIGDPVRVGVIGTGDEGNVLIGATNPDYVNIVAIADIRPYNIHRAFHGDWASDAARAARKGLMEVYGYKTEDEARKNVKVYDASNGGYHALIKDPQVEAVIVALPLHLHALAVCEALKAGKHALTEKLMAHNVAQCKVMGRLAYKQGCYLATGHQRHYSVLYDNAKHMINWGVLGEIHHIRAQWHRGNLPGHDSWQQPLPGGEVVFGDDTKPVNKILDRLEKLLKAKERAIKEDAKPEEIEKLEKQIAQWRIWDADKDVDAAAFDYEDIVLPSGRPRPALEELCRWRLWQRTGGGLMAELGSHQLDAAGIFITAAKGLGSDVKKSHPLTVHAVGGRHTFPLDRDAGDHVYCMFEFPGPGYDPSFDVGYEDETLNYPKDGIPPWEEDRNKKVVVTYSSINGNGFGGYGEVVMGTKGTLVLKQEKEVMLYKTSSTSSRVSIKDDKGGPSMDTQASGEMGAVAKAAEGPVSRGYTEEIEHWAWCIRNGDGKDAAVQPRCKPEVALGDAVIALATNVALKKAAKGEAGFVKFEDDWYDLQSDETPDGSICAGEYDKLVKEA